MRNSESPGWLARELQGSNFFHILQFWDYKHYAITSSFFIWLLRLKHRPLQKFIISRNISFLEDSLFDSLDGLDIAWRLRGWGHFAYLYTWQGKQSLIWHTQFLVVIMVDFYLSREWTSHSWSLSSSGMSPTWLPSYCFLSKEWGHIA